MKKFILQAPHELSLASNLSREPIRQLLAEGPPKRVLLCGMGGSALGGGIGRSLLWGRPNAWSFSVNRDYTFERPPSRDTLAVLVSYSGNTIEALKMFEVLKDSNASILAVAAGGKLKELFASTTGKRLAFLEIPSMQPDYQPRFSMYLTSWVLVELFSALGWCDMPVDASDISKALHNQMENFEKKGRELADFIGSGLPVVYTSARMEEAVGRSWKIKLNENSKIPCFFGSMPEVNHNEIIGFEKKEYGDFRFILIKDTHMSQQLEDRFELFAELMEKRGYPVTVLSPIASSPIPAIYHYLILADWMCYFLALKLSVDPVEIPLIQEFKSLLAKRGTV